MSEKTMWESLQTFGIKKVLHYLEDNPDTNIPKVLDWVDKLDKNDALAKPLYTSIPAENRLCASTTLSGYARSTMTACFLHSPTVL